MEKLDSSPGCFIGLCSWTKQAIFHNVCLRPRGEMGSGNLTKCEEGARKEWVGMGEGSHVRWVTMLLSAPLSIQE